MNWEMLAALGQLAAVVLGIPSLIYLLSRSENRPKNAGNRRSTLSLNSGEI